MQWGYESLRVDAVFSGHVHAYERLYVNGVMYVVSGAGGTFEPLACFESTPLTQSLSRVSGSYGFLAAEERSGVMLFRYYAVANASGDFPEYEICDQFVFLKQGAFTDPAEILSQQGILITQAGGTLAPTGDVSLGSVLLGIGPLTIAGNNVVTLTAQCKNFTGRLIVEDATLRIQYRKALSSGVALTLKKGTLDVRGLRQPFDIPLDVEGGGTIVVNRKSRLIFPGSRSAKWTNRLVIEGNPGPKSLRFGSSQSGLRPNQVAKIRFGSRKGKRARIDESGYILPVT